VAIPIIIRAQRRTTRCLMRRVTCDGRRAKCDVGRATRDASTCDEVAGATSDTQRFDALCGRWLVRQATRNASTRICRGLCDKRHITLQRATRWLVRRATRNASTRYVGGGWCDKRHVTLQRATRWLVRRATRNASTRICRGLCDKRYATHGRQSMHRRTLVV